MALSAASSHISHYVAFTLSRELIVPNNLDEIFVELGFKYNICTVCLVIHPPSPVCGATQTGSKDLFFFLSFRWQISKTFQTFNNVRNVNCAFFVFILMFLSACLLYLQVFIKVVLTPKCCSTLIHPLLTCCAVTVTIVSEIMHFLFHD